MGGPSARYAGLGMTEGRQRIKRPIKLREYFWVAHIGPFAGKSPAPELFFPTPPDREWRLSVRIRHAGILSSLAVKSKMLGLKA